MDIDDRFEQFSDDYIKFERVENKRSSRPDLHAFLLLNELVPGTNDMVSAAEHDEIFLSVEPEELNKVATDEQILELVRCGIRYNSSHDCLCMFV